MIRVEKEKIGTNGTFPELIVDMAGTIIHIADNLQVTSNDGTGEVQETILTDRVGMFIKTVMFTVGTILHTEEELEAIYGEQYKNLKESELHKQVILELEERRTLADSDMEVIEEA